MKSKYCCVIVLLAVLMFFANCGETIAQNKNPDSTPPPWRLGAYYWQEKVGENTTLNYYYIPIDHGKLDARIDFLNLPQANDKNITRLRLHYGSVLLAKSDEFQLAYRPGGMFDDTGRTYYGGRVLVNFPKMGLSIAQNSYGGNKVDFHQTFADMRIVKNVHVMYYNFSQNNCQPTSVVGPMVKFGNCGYIYYGFSTNNKDMRIINGGATFRF